MNYMIFGVLFSQEDLIGLGALKLEECGDRRDIKREEGGYGLREGTKKKMGWCWLEATFLFFL